MTLLHCYYPDEVEEVEDSNIIQMDQHRKTVKVQMEDELEVVDDLIDGAADLITEALNLTSASSEELCDQIEADLNANLKQHAKALVDQVKKEIRPGGDRAKRTVKKAKAAGESLAAQINAWQQRQR